MRKIHPSIIFILAILILFFVIVTFMQRSSSPREVKGGLPEGYGLSANYPGDVGIKNDPNIIFFEDFEEEDIRKVFERWTWRSGNNGATLELVYDSPPGGVGNKSLLITVDFTKNYTEISGYLYKLFTPGFDEVYARFYVKFDEDFQYAHHFVHLVALKNPPPWPVGGAGVRPRGDERFTTGLEPIGYGGRYPPPGIWHFYTYWHEMVTQYGTHFDPENPVPIERGKWICVEFMIKANSAPDKADGEQAFWINGKLAGRFVGFRWRTTNELKINAFWLLLYMTHNAMQSNNIIRPNPYQRVYFDNIVISTKYVGPIKPLNQTSS